jgi:hypothetical protein
VTAEDDAPRSADDPAAGAAPQPDVPLVPWEASAPPPAAAESGAGGYPAPPPFTVGALLSDTFARYGADFLRFFLVSAVASALSLLGSFAGPMSSSPFGRPTGFVDVGGLLGLAGFVVGIVGGSTLFALAEGGRDVPFGRAFRRGVERSGWYFLTSLLLGVAFGAAAVVALIPVGLFFFIGRGLALIPVVILVALFVWAALRLSLALPGTVADNRNAIEALKLSWRVSRPSGVWLRLLGAGLLLGLLAAPAALGSLMLIFPALFSGGGQLVLLLVPALGFSLFTPLASLLPFAAYRRLVPPLQPSWTMPQDSTPPVAATAMPAIDAEPAPPPPAAAAPVTQAFKVPPFGTAAKAILGLVLAFDVAGIVAIPYGVAAMERFVREGLPGFPGFPGRPGSNFPGLPGANGAVAPGQVAFGAEADLASCSLRSPMVVATASSEIKWIAVLESQVTPQDEVFLRISRDGQELEITLQDPGTYDCLGSEDGTALLVPGIYTYEVVVNGSIGATGSLFVQ